MKDEGNKRVHTTSVNPYIFVKPYLEVRCTIERVLCRNSGSSVAAVP